jgi:hypothetical protein
MSDSRDIPSPDESGPFDRLSRRECLEARVVRSVDGRVEVHGLDVVEDLSRHYSFAESMLTALSGEPPSRRIGQLFELCCTLAAPVCIAEAPAHVGRIAQTIGSNGPGLVGAVSCSLAEQVHFHAERLAEFRGWLDAPEGPAPSEAFERDGEMEGRAAALLRRLEESGVDIPGARPEMSFWALLFAVLRRCGLVDERAIVAALVAARLPAAASEALVGPTGDLSDYPLNVPRVEYKHEEAQRGRKADS